MSVISGFSPEQADLGRAAKLPASIVSDEDSSAHLPSQGSDLASDRFREKLELRAAARAAFSQADNSEAPRRPVDHQSRGMDHNWPAVSYVCTRDKRRSPNMLEKGRWSGPAQVVCQESRTIVWVNHVNRLLRA